MGLAAKVLAKAIKAGIERDAARAAAIAAPAVITKKAEKELLRKSWGPSSQVPIVTQAAAKGERIGSPVQLRAQHTSGYSPNASVQPRTPEEQFSAKFKPMLDPATRGIFDVQKLRGAYILPWMGDKMGVGNLSMVNGVPVKVATEGGAEFGEAQARRGGRAVLASAKPVIGRFRNNIRDALDRGQDVYALHGTMSPSAVDQTVNFSDLVTQLARQADIKKGHLDKFNAMTAREMPGFPGLTHDEVMPFLQNQTQGAREQMIASMDNETWRDRNFPDLAHARLAVTAPQLRDVPGGAYGAAVSKLTPDSLEALSQGKKLQHSTYPVQMAGEPVGRTEELLPYDLLLPEVLAQRRAEGSIAGGDIKSMERRNWGGTLYEQAHDDLMRYLERVKANSP